MFLIGHLVLGLYPGIVVGIRSYPEKDYVQHVLYLPFVDICLEIEEVNMGLFDERIAYKPFEYPEYYTEGWLKQAQAFWLHTEIPCQVTSRIGTKSLQPQRKPGWKYPFGFCANGVCGV